MSGALNWLSRKAAALTHEIRSLGNMPRFQVYKGKDGYRWRLFARNGKLVAESGEAFAKKPNEVTLRKLAATFEAARVEDGAS